MTIDSVFKGFLLAVGLPEVAGILSAASIFGYFTIHELKSKNVKKIQKKRVADVRVRLGELAKKASSGNGVTTEIEDEFLKLADEDYREASDPTRTLTLVDFSFLFSSISFFAAAILDWANSNPALTVFAGTSLVPLEGEVFIFGIFLLAIGIFELERLRRMESKEEDIDPPPFLIITALGVIASLNTILLWGLGQGFSTLLPFGIAFFFSLLLTYPGIIVALTTWEEEDWRRVLGVLLMVIPYILLLAVSTFQALGIPY